LSCGRRNFHNASVVIEDNVVLGAKSFVPKDMHLKKGKTYVGIPQEN